MYVFIVTGSQIASLKEVLDVLYFDQEIKMKNQIVSNSEGLQPQTDKKPRITYWKILGGAALVILLIIATLLLGMRYSQTKLDRNRLISTPGTISKPDTQQVKESAVEQIAFIKNGEIWITNEDGAEKKKVYTHPHLTFNNPALTDKQNRENSDYFNENYFTDLSWSKDGGKLAVTAFSENIESEAENPQVVEKYYLNSVHYWSPPHGDIHLVDIDTGKAQVIPEKTPRSYVYSIRWSDDNDQIIFRRKNPGNKQNEIVLLELDSLRETKIADTEWSIGIEWFSKTNLVIYNDKGSYHINEPFPAIVKINYETGVKNENPFEVTKGYRPQFFRILNNGKVIYYNNALGPQYGTSPGMYEIRTSNLGGTTNEILYSGSGCDEETHNICIFLDFSPNGKHLLGQLAGGFGKIYHIYNPKFPKKAVTRIKSRSLQSFSWDKTGDKLAYVDDGSISVSNLLSGVKNTIIKDTDIKEL